MVPNFNREHTDGPCKRDCEGRSATCHVDCPKYIAWKEELNKKNDAAKKENARFDTMSHRAKREMWKGQRWSRQQSKRRFNPDR